MIGWIGGRVRLRDPMAGIVVVEAGGVGYLLTVSWQTFAQTPEVGGECELWVHTHVREDALALFGFATPEEKRMFGLLTSVPQVGPKLAIGVLGGFPLRELLDAIHGGERELLERIPGVGKRTAERILLDLTDKVEPLWLEAHGAATNEHSPQASASGDALQDEAKAVLVNLGWKAKQVAGALQQAAENDPPPRELDALVRAALAALMAR